MDAGLVWALILGLLPIGACVVGFLWLEWVEAHPRHTPLIVDGQPVEGSVGGVDTPPTSLP